MNKVTLGNSYWTRESKYDIGVGSTNETKKFSLVITGGRALTILYFQRTVAYHLDLKVKNRKEKENTRT